MKIVKQIWDNGAGEVRVSGAHRDGEIRTVRFRWTAEEAHAFKPDNVERVMEEDARWLIAKELLAPCPEPALLVEHAGKAPNFPTTLEDLRRP